MDTFIPNLVGILGERVSGPMHLRLVLQPLMAALFAARDGLKDARRGSPPYGWLIITNSERRRELLRDGWKSIGKVFVFATVLDAAYQILVRRPIHPAEAVMIGFLLAILPYVLLRGISNRLGSKRTRTRSSAPGG